MGARNLAPKSIASYLDSALQLSDHSPCSFPEKEEWMGRPPSRVSRVWMTGPSAASTELFDDELEERR